jgi:hypothetical protein
MEIPLTPLAFVWFVWSPDLACLEQSIRSVRLLEPEATLHIRVDPDHPLPDADRDRLLRSGVHTIQTSAHSHGGNLNGATHLFQQLDALQHAAQKRLTHPVATHPEYETPHHPQPARIAVKIDADIVLRSLDWLQPMRTPDSEINATGFRASEAAPWCGPCYAVRSGVPRLCRDTLAEVLHQGHEALLLPRGLPEDATLLALMKRAHLRGVLTFPAWPDPHWFSGHQYNGADPLSSVAYYGNRHLLTGTEEARRATTAAAMATAIDQLHPPT